MQSKYLCLALVAPMTIVLHGCGGGDPSPSPSPPAPPGPSPPAPGPDPAPAPGPPVPATPWDPATAVSTLNEMYMNFDESDDNTAMGVTISMAGQTSSFNENLFCSELMGTQCYQGQADCRMSASLFNHKVLVNGTMLSPTMSRPIGYVFNQHLTETFWGKCAYIWDGADSSKLNGGCGAGADGNSCGDQRSAFYNQCDTDPTEPHNCTATDFEITSQKCKGEDANGEPYGEMDPPAEQAGQTCFYEMPALVYGDSTTTNHWRDSVKQRIAFQGTDPAMTTLWNEVVIDNKLLIPRIQSNPTDAIWAFVCVITPDIPNACDLAVAMRDEFQTAYSVEGTIPVVHLDASADFSTAGGPFTLPPARQIIA